MHAGMFAAEAIVEALKKDSIDFSEPTTRRSRTRMIEKELYEIAQHAPAVPEGLLRRRRARHRDDGHQGHASRGGHWISEPDDAEADVHRQARDQLPASPTTSSPSTSSTRSSSPATRPATTRPNHIRIQTERAARGRRRPGSRCARRRSTRSPRTSSRTARRRRPRHTDQLRAVRRDHRQGRPPDAARGRRRPALPDGLTDRNCRTAEYRKRPVASGAGLFRVLRQARSDRTGRSAPMRQNTPRQGFADAQLAYSAVTLTATNRSNAVLSADDPLPTLPPVAALAALAVIADASAGSRGVGRPNGEGRGIGRRRRSRSPSAAAHRPTPTAGSSSARAMSAIAGGGKMELRYTLYRRYNNQARYRIVQPTEGSSLGQWLASSDTGATKYIHNLAITPVETAAVYRVKVSYRWLRLRGQDRQAREAHVEALQAAPRPAQSRHLKRSEVPQRQPDLPRPAGDLGRHGAQQRCQQRFAAGRPDRLGLRQRRFSDGTIDDQPLKRARHDSRRHHAHPSALRPGMPQRSGRDHGRSDEPRAREERERQRLQGRLQLFAESAAARRPIALAEPRRPSILSSPMKTEIHPNYVEAHVTCSCGNAFVTRSTKSELHVELCSECHPFYTGKQKLVDTGGRVERFQRRAAKSARPAGRKPRLALRHGLRRRRTEPRVSAQRRRASANGRRRSGYEEARRRRTTAAR